MSKAKLNSLVSLFTKEAKASPEELEMESQEGKEVLDQVSEEEPDAPSCPHCSGKGSPALLVPKKAKK